MPFNPPPFLQQRLTHLEAANHKAFYLSFLRVAICVWLLKEVAIKWTCMEMLYGKSGFMDFPANGSGFAAHFFLFTRLHYEWLIIGYVFFILLNMGGIGRWFTGLAVFILLWLVQGLNLTILNGGDLMARQIVFFLIFADSYQYFVFIKKKTNKTDGKKLKLLISNLSAFSIMLQLCLAYFAAFLAKVKEPLWLNGEATYYALANERFWGTAINGWIVKHVWIDYLSNYGTLLFELAFPFLIWIKQLRPPLLFVGFVFHLTIYIFMMIYGFEIVFLLTYGLFLPNDLLLKYAGKVNIFFGINNRAIIRYIGLADDSIPIRR